MREGVIFEMTKDHLQMGMRNIPVGYCSTSHVDPQKGLFYVGRPIFEMVLFKPIEVIFLLFYGREGTKKEIEEFEEEIKNRSKIDERVIEHINRLPKEGDPLELFAMALTLLGIYEKKSNYREDCLNAIAKIPFLAAQVIRYHAGWEKAQCEEYVDYVENFVNLLEFEEKERIVDAFRYIQILHFDHGGGPVDAFVGKCVASAREHLFGALAAAMYAFSGEWNSKASLHSLNWIRELSERSHPEEIERKIQEKIEKKERIFGFGYPSLKIEDSRATMLYNYARKHFPEHPLIKIALQLRYHIPQLLSKYSSKKDLYPNTDAIVGSVFVAAGFDRAEYIPLILGASRCVGIAIQIMHEHEEGLGKKMPLIHPHYFFRSRI